jgi:hypothetical protein
MCWFRIEAALSQTASLLITRATISRNKRISCPPCGERIETISCFSLPFFGHDIGQQAIRECKEIYGKRIAKKLYFGNNVCVFREIKNRVYK